MPRRGRGALYALVVSAFPLKAKSITDAVEQLVIVADDNSPTLNSPASLIASPNDFQPNNKDEQESKDGRHELRHLIHRTLCANKHLPSLLPLKSVLVVDHEATLHFWMFWA